MGSRLERPATAPPSLRQLLTDFGPGYAANGFIGWLFAATAPVAIILSVGNRGGLSEPQLASWLFGAFFVNGLVTLLFCWLYRQPLAFFWTIPGTVLVGPALAHLRFAEMVGAYVATGLLILLLGASGWVRRERQAVPMPIVMGMVACVFLRFGLDLVRALHQDPAIAGAMVAAWLLLSLWPAAARRLPPLIGALLAGALAIARLSRFDTATLGAIGFARPPWPAPAWSWAAMVELMIPLAITVLVVQNGQGIAVQRAAGHEPPVNAITVACGVGALTSPRSARSARASPGPPTRSSVRRARSRGTTPRASSPACWRWASACWHQPARG